MGARKREVTLPAIFMATLLLNAGAAFMWPLTTVYMHDYLHETLALSGMTILAMSGFMIFGNWFGGWLFDHWSPYKTGVLGVAISTLAVMILIVSHGWPMFGLMLLLIGLGDGISMTVANSFAATVTSISSRRVFNILYIGLNLGVVVGTLLVGFLLKYGVTVVFAAMSVAYGILLVIMLTAFNVDPEVALHESREAAGGHPQLRLIWLICLLVFALYLAYALWESVISVHMIHLGISFEKYSLLWTLNGLLIVVGQPIANRLGARFKLSQQIWTGTLVFILSFLLLVVARQYSTFILTMIILTVGEMVGFPGMPAWVNALAGDGDKGKFQGMYNMAISFGRAAGPLYGGLVIEYGSYQVLFLSVTILMLVALGAVMWQARRPVKS